MKSPQRDKPPVFADAPTEAEVRTDDLEVQPPPAIRKGEDERLARIRQAAYAKYEQRGFVPGHEEEDWLEAEREIDSQTADAADGGRGLSS